MRKLSLVLISLALMACNKENPAADIEVWQSTAQGDRLLKLDHQPAPETSLAINLKPETRFQEIDGFGGALTESSSHLLQQLPAEQRAEVLKAYFDPNQGAYTIARLHINSCDFSLNSYDYIEEGDTSLSTFDLAPDREDIIPIARQALETAQGNLRFFASPWTASPWMKDNNAWFGGKLLPEYYDLWARYFVRYAQEYQKEGIPIWGFTVENEPLGNDANWESMHFSPEEMAHFVKHFLAPRLQEAGLDAEIMVYDQNRGEELVEWAEVLLQDEELKPLIFGTAVHWYTSTFKWFPESLQATHKLAPEKKIWNTEACVDAEVPHWQDDAWYWKKEATDWGYTWAPEEDKADHPKYVPVYRYARDIIGCLNNRVSAWVDWNIVLDREGGPNHASNWCVAPVIADTTAGEVYFTPLYDALRHFSHFIKPGAYAIDWQGTIPEGLHLCAVQNPDGSLIIPILNTSNQDLSFNWKMDSKSLGQSSIPAGALQTLVIQLKEQ